MNHLMHGLLNFCQVLTVNISGTVWLCIRAVFYLLKLGEMLTGSLACAIAVHGHHIQNDAVMDDAIYCRDYVG